MTYGRDTSVTPRDPLSKGFVVRCVTSVTPGVTPASSDCVTYSGKADNRREIARRWHAKGGGSITSGRPPGRELRWRLQKNSVSTPPEQLEFAGKGQKRYDVWGKNSVFPPGLTANCPVRTVA